MMDKPIKDLTPGEREAFLQELKKKVTPEQWEVFTQLAQLVTEVSAWWNSDDVKATRSEAAETLQVLVGFSDFLPALLEEIENDAKYDELIERAAARLERESSKGMENMTPEQVRTAITDNLLANAYLPMLNGALVNDFMKINTRGLKADEFTKKAVYVTKDGHKFTIEHFDKLQKALSTPAKKMLNTAVMFLTANNFYNTDRIMPTVEIPLIEYGERCGYQLTPRKMATPAEQAAEDKAVQKRIVEFKKDVRRNLRDIKSATWTAEETKGRNMGDYDELSIISRHKIVNGYIRINFDVDAAAYLVQSYLMQHPTALLAVDNRNPNAYALGYKIAQHNSMDTNVARGTNNTLSVERLLAAAPEIQTMDDLRKKGQRNWKDKIKRPLENSLNELVKVKVLSKWEYRDPTTGTTYTPETAQPLTWPQYNRLMVDFIMVNAPDQNDRRKAREQAKAAADKETPRKKRGRPPKKG